MASNFVCPSCQKRLNVRSDLQGRSVRCPACQAKVVVQLDAPADPFLADENELFPPESPPDSGTAHSPYEQLAADLLTRGASPYAASAATSPAGDQAATRHQAAAKPAASPYAASPYAAGRHVANKKSSSDDEDNLPLFVRIGGFLMVIAVLSMILPFFGLQIKGLHLAGEAGSLLGLMLGLLGAAVVGVGYLVSGNIVASLLAGVVPGIMLVAFSFGLGLAMGGGKGNTGPRVAQNQVDTSRSSRPPAPSPFQQPTSPNSASRFGAPSFGPGRTSTSTTKTTSSTFQNATPTSPRSAGTDSSNSAANVASGAASPPAAQGNRGSNSSAPFNAPEADAVSNAKSGFAMDENPGAFPESFGEFQRSIRSTGAFSQRSFDQARNLHDLLRRQSKMESDLGAKLANNFPPEFLTKVVGQRHVRTVVLVHPERKPMIGLDYAVGTINESELGAMIPVFWESEDSQISAKDGYAIAGLNLNEQDKILGFQVVFMKLAGKSYDTSDTYSSDWFGAEPADGKGVTLGCDGRPVYGIVTHGFHEVTGIQLIIEPAKKSKN